MAVNLAGGDLSLMGLGVTGLYLTGAVACGRAGRRSWTLGNGDAWGWVLIGAVLLLLGINKQVDLQQIVRVTAASFARSWGWYEHRRMIQAAALIGIASGLGVGGLGWLWWVRRRRGLWLATAGAGVVGGFVLLRAATFYHAADPLLRPVGSQAIVLGLEPIGPLVILAAAVWAAIRRRPAQGPPTINR